MAPFAKSDCPSETTLSSHLTDGQASPRKGSSRGVAFGDVRVIEHSVELGDNPAVSSGLPLALGNKRGSETFSVEKYEKVKPAKAAEKISKKDREEIVRGRHTRSSIVKVQKEIKGIQTSRQQIKEAEDAKRTRTKGYKAPWLIRKMRTALGYDKNDKKVSK